MKNIKIVSIVFVLVLLASWWVVGQAHSESTVDDCNYEEECKNWCENPDEYTINFNTEPPADDCNYEEKCEEWCADPDPDPEDEQCIPTNNILFDLNFGIIKVVGYIDLELPN